MAATLDFQVEAAKRGKSLRSLAADIGVSEDVLYTADKGGRPRAENALKIAKYFGRDVLDVFPLPLEREAA